MFPSREAAVVEAQQSEEAAVRVVDQVGPYCRQHSNVEEAEDEPGVRRPCWDNDVRLSNLLVRAFPVRCVPCEPEEELIPH